MSFGDQSCSASRSSPAETVDSGADHRLNVPWHQGDVSPLPVRIAYRHLSGAVTRVALDEPAVSAIDKQTMDTATDQQDLRMPRGAAYPWSDMPSEEQQSPTARTAPDIPPSVIIGGMGLTQGNLDNAHIYLRSFFDSFPRDAVGGSNRAGGAPRTVLVAGAVILRSRPTWAAASASAASGAGSGRSSTARRRSRAIGLSWRKWHPVDIACG